MARPKVDVIANVVAPDVIRVFCSDRSSAVREIENIEGACWVDNLSTGCIHVHTDPRYDVNELRDEIYQLLTASVPDIFKED